MNKMVECGFCIENDKYHEVPIKVFGEVDKAEYIKTFGHNPECCDCHDNHPEAPLFWVEIEEDDKDIESYYDGYDFDNWTDPDTEPDPIANCWSYERGNNEGSFEGHHVNAYYQDGENVDVTFFAVHNNLPVAYSDTVSLPKKVADNIIEDIEMNPENYVLQSYLDYKGNTVYSLCRYLEKMPFDKNGIHATGREYLETNGDWITEYEDDIPDGYVPQYIYFDNNN